MVSVDVFLLQRLMLSKSNFLILDEPTNHLDIVSKEILEKAIQTATPARCSMSRTTVILSTRLQPAFWSLKNQTLVNYIGNYDYYLEKSEELTKIYAPEQEKEHTEAPAAASSRDDWARQKELQAKERKRQNDLKKTEDKITKLEERSSEIDMLMTKEEVFTDVAKCTELSKEKAALVEEIDQLYELWEQLQET